MTEQERKAEVKRLVTVINKAFIERVVIDRELDALFEELEKMREKDPAGVAIDVLDAFKEIAQEE